MATINQVATPVLHQRTNRGRPRKYPGYKSHYFVTPTSATEKKKTNSDPSRANHPARTSQSVFERNKCYRLTHALKNFVRSCTAISVELWESFRVDRRNSCGLCGALVEEADVLREHILEHVFLKCLLCGAYFSQLELFKSHVQQHKLNKFDSGVLPCSSAILNVTNSKESISGSGDKVESEEKQLNSVQNEEEWGPFGIRKAISDKPYVVNVGRSMPELDFSEVVPPTDESEEKQLNSVQNEEQRDPFGIRKAISDKSTADECTPSVVYVGRSMPELDFSELVLPTDDEKMDEKCPTLSRENDENIDIGSKNVPHDHIYCKYVKRVSKRDQETIELDSSFGSEKSIGGQVESITSSTLYVAGPFKIPKPIKRVKLGSNLNTDIGEGFVENLLHSKTIGKEPFEMRTLPAVNHQNVSQPLSLTDDEIEMPTIPVANNCNISQPATSQVSNELSSDGPPAKRSISQSISLSADDIEMTSFLDPNNKNVSETVSLMDGVIETVLDDGKNDDMVEDRQGCSESKHQEVPSGPGKKIEATETVSNELSSDGPPAKRRKNAKNTSKTSEKSRHRAKNGQGRVSSNELKSLFYDLPKSFVGIVPKTPFKRVTRRSVLSGSACKTVSSTAKKPVSRSNVEKKNMSNRISSQNKNKKKNISNSRSSQNTSNSTKVDFLARLYVEKTDDVPKAAFINIEMLERQASGWHKKKLSKVSRTTISGKDFKSISWFVPSKTSNHKFRANDRQWKKLLENAKASDSPSPLDESESDIVDNQRLQRVTNDVSRTESDEMNSGILAGMQNFEVVDVRNLSESTRESFANEINDSAKDEDPLAVSLEDALELDRVIDVAHPSDELLTASRVVKPSDLKVKFDQEKFRREREISSATDISMDDVPELVEGQWLVKYIVYQRFNIKVDRIVAFPSKKSYFFGFNDDDMKGLSEKIPEDEITEERTFFCDYRNGNHITMPVQLGTKFQGAVSPTPVVENDGILGSGESHGMMPDDVAGSEELGSCSTNEKWKELMALEMDIMSSNEVIEDLEKHFSQTNLDAPLKDENLKLKSDANYAKNDGRISPVLVNGAMQSLSSIKSDLFPNKVSESSEVSKSDSNLQHLTKNSRNFRKHSIYWGFSDSENDIDPKPVNTPQSPDGKDTTENEGTGTRKAEFCDNKTAVSKSSCMTSSVTRSWDQLDQVLRKIDGVPVSKVSSTTSMKPRSRSFASFTVAKDSDTPTDVIGHIHLQRDLGPHRLPKSGTCPGKLDQKGVLCPKFFQDEIRDKRSSVQKPVLQPSCSSVSNDVDVPTGAMDDQFIGKEGRNEASRCSQIDHHRRKNTSCLNDVDVNRSEASSRPKCCGLRGIKMETFDDPHFSEPETCKMRLHDELLENVDEDEDLYCYAGSESCSSGSLSPDYVDDIILKSEHTGDGPRHPGRDLWRYQCRSPMVLRSPSRFSSASSDQDHFQDDSSCVSLSSDRSSD